MKKTVFAEEAEKLFFRIAAYIREVRRNADSLERARFEDCGSEGRPGLIMSRKPGEPIAAFLRKAQSLSFLFLGEKFGDMDCNELPVRMRMLSNELVVLEAADGKAVLTQKEIQRISEMVKYGKSVDRFADEIGNALPNIGERPDDIYWTNGEDYICRDEYAADALADLLEALEYTAATGYYDPVEDASSNETDLCTGKWYVHVD